MDAFLITANDAAARAELGLAIGTNVVGFNGALGTPISGSAANLTGYATTNLSGLGTGVAAVLAVSTGSAGSVLTNGGAAAVSTITASGTATFNGDIMLGDTNADVLSIAARFNNALIPVGNGSRDIGSTGLRFRDGFFTGNITATSFTDSGKVITAAGTTGARTINAMSGSVNFAAAATSLVVTNSLVTANSVVFCGCQSNDATMRAVRWTVAAGSITILANTAPTAETAVVFTVTSI